MSLAKRLEMLEKLRTYMLGNDPHWKAAKEKAFHHNGWFIPAFIDLAIEHIAAFLEPSHLQQWLRAYSLPDMRSSPKTIGIVLPGNVPLAGFHDVVCAYLSGHRQRIKLSPRDEVLPRHLAGMLTAADDPPGLVSFGDMLKGCDAYLATGGNSSSLFQQYLNKYPGLIRSPGRAAAVLTGRESRAELELLADDVFTYFGQGCLNVTKLYVPRQYDFIPLLKAFEKYSYLADHNKYKNNYDYQLSMLILNKEVYMTNGCILLTHNSALRSPIGRLNYEYYDEEMAVFNDDQALVAGKTLECKGYAPFGLAGRSVMCRDLNGMDTLQFLLDL